MAKKATNEELLAQLDDPTDGGAPAAAADGADDDPLAELENLAKERPKSQPYTPRDKPRSSTEQTAPPSSTVAAAPPPPAAATAAAETAAPASDAPTGGWWGALSGAASAAVKQAEALAKELQKNEDAQRWAEQAKGHMGTLRSYGGELRDKALPTFNTLLHTLAPPIAAHERLHIHVAHDLVGYPSLDPLIYGVFARVMAQVEGGELLVVQRGAAGESGRRDSEAGYAGSGAAGWSDGPWWRAPATRSLGAVAGPAAGVARAQSAAEAHAADFFAARGGPDAAAAAAAGSDTNPTRTSDIFLALQAVTHAVEHRDERAGVAEPEALVSFAVYLHDPLHSITFDGLSQAIPQTWTVWLEGAESDAAALDPREWASEWLEEVLALAVGIVAQKYVARRMGVGSGAFAKGKAREGPVDAGAGEAARAM